MSITEGATSERRQTTEGAQTYSVDCDNCNGTGQARDEPDKEQRTFAATRSHQDMASSQYRVSLFLNLLVLLNGGAAGAFLPVYANVFVNVLKDMDLQTILSLPWSLTSWTMVFLMGAEIAYLLGVFLAVLAIDRTRRGISGWSHIWEAVAYNKKTLEEARDGAGQVYSSECTSDRADSHYRWGMGFAYLSLLFFIFASVIVGFALLFSAQLENIEAKSPAQVRSEIHWEFWWRA